MKATVEELYNYLDELIEARRTILNSFVLEDNEDNDEDPVEFRCIELAREASIQMNDVRPVADFLGIKYIVEPMSVRSTAIHNWYRYSITYGDFEFFSLESIEEIEYE